MRILFVDGGNPSRGLNEPFNLNAAEEVAETVQQFIGTSTKTIVVYDNSLDANQTSAVISKVSKVSNWKKMPLEVPTLRPMPDILTMYRINEIIKTAASEDRDVVFVVCFADMRVRAMLNLFKIMMNSAVEIPRFPIYRATFSVYVIDTKLSSMTRLP